MRSKMPRTFYLKYLLSFIIILIGLLLCLYFTIYNLFSTSTFADSNRGNDPSAMSVSMNPDLIWYPSMIFLVVAMVAIFISYIRASQKYEFKGQKDFKKRPNVAISYSNNHVSDLPIKTSKEILNEIQNSERLIKVIDEEELNNKIEMTLLTEDLIKNMDLINWVDEKRKKNFVQEILALTLEEREEVIEYMLEKSREG